MSTINLRDYYPFYTADCFIEVPDEVADVLAALERAEVALRLRTYRHKAYFSLDRGTVSSMKLFLFLFRRRKSTSGK